MPLLLENQYLQSLFEQLITDYETEINYDPLFIELDPKKCTIDDIPSLNHFLAEHRKRLFIFNIEGQDAENQALELRARRFILSQTAEHALKNSTHGPQINPLKRGLTTPETSVRAGIQIQKSFILPEQNIAIKKSTNHVAEEVHAPELLLEPIDFTNLPNLVKHLYALGITQIDSQARAKINDYPDAFTDGLIPNNLPCGFYINHEMQALCYTETPTKLPTNLAPVLKRIEPSLLPTFEIARSIVPNAISDDKLKVLLDEKNSSSQHHALVHVLPNYKDKIEPLLKLFTPNQHEAIIPIIAKMFVFGGEAHSTLVCTLLSTCIKKNICLEFLSKPEMHTALLTPQGIKNLQKLIALPQEGRAWWNALVASHLKNKMHSFDFNQLFEAYAQIFIPKIQEKKLTLPTPCPINHDGHMLLTLNRIQEVLEHSANPQEQCMSLSDLNWGPTGVHFAMTQVSASKRLKQAASCMKVATPADLEINLDTLHEQLNDQEIELKPSLFRFIGQHWNAKIELKTIQAQWDNIEQNTALDPIEKRQLLFITTASFPANIELDSTQWVNHLNACVSLLQSLEASVKKEIFGLLSHCYQFKPIPSIVQLNKLITLCIELKKTDPSSLAPFSSFLQHEGFDLLQTLKECFEKNKMDNQQFFAAIIAFSKTIDEERDHLSPIFINMLAKLNEPKIDATTLNPLKEALNELKAEKGDYFYHLTLNTLTQINISKSQKLPTSAQIKKLLIDLKDLKKTIPAEQNTEEKQEAWLKQFIIENILPPGCVLGNGDISKLDDLLVDALVDAIKKRSAALNVSQLKQTLQKYLKGLPNALIDQLDKELIPVFDALDELVKLLKQTKPKFESVLDKLKIFEDKKPTLLNGEYSVGVLGKSKGEFLLSLLLTGTKKEPQDTITGNIFSSILVNVHQLFISKMDAFFADAQNMQSIKDLNTQIALSWMRSFNETHALTFFFKEELIEKKVIPALKKTLKQLHTEDQAFEAHILEAATHLQEHGRSDDALKDYKLKIESIAKYLNLMINIKDTHPDKFKALLTQLNNSTLNRLNFNQKASLIPVLLQQGNESLANYLTTLSHILDNHPQAQAEAIERAVSGIVELFELNGLEHETKTMFFNMSVSHNLINESPFPLAALNNLKKLELPDEEKSLIIKQIINLLSQMPRAESPDCINRLVIETQSFLIAKPQYIKLCTALLKKINQEHIFQDIDAYANTLSEIKANKPEVSDRLETILINLANNKKDDTVNLSTLLEITKGFARSVGYLEPVLTLFETPPYPTAESLNLALISPHTEKPGAFCLNFDKNPHARTGEQRNFAAHFATDRIKESLLNLKDLLHDVSLPHSLEIKLAEQLTYIELLGYTNPLNPQDVTGHKKLTNLPRHELKAKAAFILNQLRAEKIAPEAIELKQLELLAYLREIYFRAIGIFPNTTQMLILLLSIHQSKENLLMSIKTGEGKSIITPILSILQWAQGGTVNQCTANPTLLIRDYENSCEPFFTFLGIDSALIQSDSHPEQYKLDGINCSTIEDLSLFQLAAKESNQERLLQNNRPIHLVLDECDDALLDQTTLYKLVREQDTSTNEQNHAQWIYPLAHQFINLESFQNTDPSRGAVWDEEMDLDEFRLFLNKAINEAFQGDAQKQNFIMASSKTQLRQWIDASCRAATLVENKHFLIQPLKEKDESGQEKIKKNICVPLIRSTPKTGSIFTEGVHQALQARLIAEQGDGIHYLSIDSDPQVLSSQSARGLIKKCQKTQGRLVGISATPGNIHELQGLFSLLGTQAFGFAPHAGDRRKKHQPVFSYSRDGRIKAIHAAINQIKCPITETTMKLNPKDSVQTYEQREAHMLAVKLAIEKWNQTQTQPILIINEDFDEAKILGAKLESFKKEGVEIQIVTGKETPEELDRIIKKAGECNTITVGTAMLAKGIDINTGSHPKGLFVIQSYPDTERMSTQISGRAARNGKPGEWLPIYEIKPPKNFFQKLLYYIFPSYRKKFNEQKVEKLTNQMQTQATIDRLYTQAIDEVQHTLMQQVEAWEGFLRELYPEDANLSSELYQWREAIQSELAHIQEMHISQKTLQESINKFKLSAQKLWETKREEQWMVKAQRKEKLDEEQTLRFNYLKHIDLAKECSVQSGLHQQKAALKEATVARANQNLDSVLANKAGVYLNYQESTLPDDEKNKLLLAQKIQLLPYLLGELCSAYPQAIDTVCPENKFTGLHFLPKAINTWFGNLIHKKNKFFLNAEKERLTKQSIVASVQQQLVGTTEETVNQLLNRIKPVLIAFDKEFSSQSLVTQFKMHGLMGQFINFYPSTHSIPNDPFEKLKEKNPTRLISQLLLYLIKEFAWVGAKPKPFHALLERAAGIEAAQSIYTLASSLLENSIEPHELQKLYTELQKHRIVLKDVYLCSISHTSPREVIKTALSAIDSIAHAPHCDSIFRAEAQDKTLAQHHLSLFSNCLEKASAPYVAKNDTLWNYLNKVLKTKINPDDKHPPIHGILELYETIERFKQYESYKPYKKHLNRLAARLLDSLNVLNGTEGLNEHLETHLLNQKQKDIASLLGVSTEQVCIQRASNGIESYIEVQVEKAHPLNDGFSGYQSTFISQLEHEKSALKNKRQALEAGLDSLFNSANAPAHACIPEGKKAWFTQLIQIKSLLNQDIDAFDKAIVSLLPKNIQNLITRIQSIKAYDWTIAHQDDSKITGIFTEDERLSMRTLLDVQAHQLKYLQEIQQAKEKLEAQILEKKAQLAEIEQGIQSMETQKNDPNCSYLESVRLNLAILGARQKHNWYNNLSSLNDALKQTSIDEASCWPELNEVNQKLMSHSQKLCVTQSTKVKTLLTEYIEEQKIALTQGIAEEYERMDASIEKIKEQELHKSRYQVRRFFNSSELLRYEAELKQEQKNIPQKTVEAKKGSVSEIDLLVSMSGA